MSRASDLWPIGLALLLFFALGSKRSEEGGEEERVKLRPDYIDPDDESPVVEVVIPHLTPATFDEMMTAYVKAYREATGEPPTSNMLAMLLAHSALETGQWKEMWENNPVNMTTSRNRGYYRLENDPQHKYRPFKDRFRGALAHVVLLARRYPRAMARMLEGNASGVAYELKTENPSGPFFESDEVAYGSSLSRLFSQFLPRVPGPVAT